MYDSRAVKDDEKKAISTYNGLELSEKCRGCYNDTPLNNRLEKKQ